MFGLSTETHKKHISAVKRHLKKSASSSILISCTKTTELFFGGMSVEEIEIHDNKYWTYAIVDYVKSIKKMSKGSSIVRVFNPIKKVHGYENNHTVIQISCMDMPFLVDSVAFAFTKLGLEMELMTHPIAYVERSKVGIIKELGNTGADKESWMHIEINQLKDKSKLNELLKEIELVIKKVSACVVDWKEMLEKMHKAKDELQETDNKKILDRQKAYIDWLLHNNFTFLGYQYYQVSAGKKTGLVANRSSALGLFSSKEFIKDVDQLADNNYQIEKQSGLVIVTKLNARPRIHREGTLDHVGIVVVDKKGKVIGEHRFVGLYTSAAINTRPWDIPYINDKVNAVVKRFKFDKSSHTGKHIAHLMETLPRDELMQSSSDELYNTIYSIITIGERQKANVSIRQDKFKHFYTFLVHIPRDKFNTNARHTIQDILMDLVDGSHIEFEVKIEDINLTRIYITVYSSKLIKTNSDELQGKIADALRTWQDELEEKLIDKLGKVTGYALAQKYAGHFPAAYMEDVAPHVAAYDVENAAKLNTSDDLQLSLYRPRDISSKIFRFKIFRQDNTIPLSEVLPILENLGLHVVRERPYRVSLSDGKCFWIQDFDLSLVHGAELELGLVKDRFKEAFKQIVRGSVDNDGFNKLLILGGLTSRQIIILRAISKYLKQTNLPFSQEYLEKAVIAQPHISRWLIELFAVKFAVSLDGLSVKEHKEYLQEFKKKFALQASHLNIEITDHQQNALDGYFKSAKFNRKRQEKKVVKILKSLLDSVSSQDEDTIIRAFAEVVLATLRTNFYQVDAEGETKPYVSFKLNSSKVPQMPKPVPFREIFAYSPRFEAIHLRMGEVARGGLRWSDRYEDFRTEVLGLMKAQNVKNSIIVPVGSKGGFVCKQLPTDGDRDAFMKEGIACYQNFIRSMLDLTDNIIDGEIVHPQNVIRYDNDDPYLVVAADKGTATFSDIANGISADYDHWLGDAFASGGSVGYDHKGMGITAKGAWESVKRHFRELGVDCQSEDFSVVGIGDMMGDVFGNGMLLSKHICLKAAFNHMHIFLDPNPDSGKSWKERERMFNLPRSSWSDYNAKLISKGGGIFSRFDKSIPLSSEVKKWLGLSVDEISPQALIKTLLKCKVGLLWNGGIGTYVKASSESHEEVGDSANNSLRVDGKELNCKVIGEGGNLGFTQLGRIEYAEKGGKINTDFIDNSAGVDCSDHEVNIKILVQEMMNDGKYNAKTRVKLLASMTEDVGKLVLKNNYSQTQTLSMMEYHAKQRLGAKAHLIRVLEKRGLLDREIEFLPTNQQLKQRQVEGKGLSRPELCVLLSYTKLALFEDLLTSDILEDQWFATILKEYFPAKLQKLDVKYRSGHRLHREIIATILTSKIIDRMGATFMQRTFEDTGASVGSIAKAYIVAVELFGAEDIWQEIEQLDLTIKPKHQIQGGLIVWNHIRQATRWILTSYAHNFKITDVIKELKSDVGIFTKNIDKVLPPKDVVAIKKRDKVLLDAAYPKSLAEKIANIEYSFAALDIVEIAKKTNTSVPKAAIAFFALGEKLNLLWLRDMIEKLIVIGPWHAHARGVLRDELFEHHNALTQIVIDKYGKSKTGEVVDAWVANNKQSVRSVRQMLQQMRSEKSSDYATVMVAVRSINNLVSANQ